MSQGLGYAPPEAGWEGYRNLAMLLLGGVLCLTGVLLINQGVDLAKELGPRLVVSVGLLATGCLLVLVGLSHPWPGATATAVLFVSGLLCLVGSGLAAAEDPRGIAYAVTLTLIGIALIVVGVRVVARSWRLVVGKGERIPSRKGKAHPF
ncbi:MAG: hypothetical protein QXM46_03305 [Candidatus Hadarchaeales archaeon]